MFLTFALFFSYVNVYVFSFADSKYEDLSIKRNFSQKKKKILNLQLLAGFENFDHGLTDIAKLFESNPCKETFEDLVKVESFNRIVTELFEDNIGWSYIKYLSLYSDIY